MDTFSLLKELKGNILVSLASPLCLDANDAVAYHLIGFLTQVRNPVIAFRAFTKLLVLPKEKYIFAHVPIV